MASLDLTIDTSAIREAVARATADIEALAAEVERLEAPLAKLGCRISMSVEQVAEPSVTVERGEDGGLRAVLV